MGTTMSAIVEAYALYHVPEEPWPETIHRRKGQPKGYWYDIATLKFQKDYGIRQHVCDAAPDGWPEDIGYLAQKLEDVWSKKCIEDTQLLKMASLKSPPFAALKAMVKAFQKDGWKTRVLFYCED